MNSSTGYLGTKLTPRSLDRKMIGALFIILPVLTCLGVLYVMLLFRSQPNHLRQESSDAKAMPSSSPEELTFRGLSVLDGRTKDGARFSSYLYKSSDCVTISDTNIFFDTPRRARLEIANQARAATSTIDSGPKTDGKGKQVGERRVLKFAATEQNQIHVTIVWSDGPQFHSVDGPSVRHTIEFEKALNSPGSGKISMRLADVRSVDFEVKGEIEGKTPEGVSFSERSFRSSDCETLLTRVEYFDSPAKANIAFEMQLNKAINIIERGPKVDAGGQQVGVRAVAAFRAELSDASMDQTIVLWTQGSEYHFIKGRFPHVLEFEKRNNQ